MRASFLILIASFSLTASSCVVAVEDKDKPGSEGEPCYGNGTCDDNLTCAGGYCVDLNATEPDTGLAGFPTQPDPPSDASGPPGPGLPDSGPFEPDNGMPDTAPPVQDTWTPPQDTAPPTGPAPSSGLHCDMMDNCVGAQMDTLCPNVPDYECQELAIEICGAQAASPIEVQLFQAKLDCHLTCLSQFPTYSPAFFGCMMNQCINIELTCKSGGIYGNENCVYLGGCIQSCGADPDGSCNRQCYMQASADAGIKYIAIVYCYQGECYAEYEAGTFNQCAAASRQPGGACSVQVQACMQ